MVRLKDELYGSRPQGWVHQEWTDRILLSRHSTSLLPAVFRVTVWYWIPFVCIAASLMVIPMLPRPVDDPSGMMYMAVIRHSQEHRLGKISIYVHYCRIVVLNFIFALLLCTRKCDALSSSPAAVFLLLVCLRFLRIGQHYLVWIFSILHSDIANA